MEKLSSSTKKSTSSKKENLKHKYHHVCPCALFLLSKKRNKKQRDSKLKKKQTLKLIKAETIKKLKDISPVANRAKRSHVTRIPENGFGTLTSLFADLSNSGKLQLDDDELLKAVQITTQAKSDLDGGKLWNGDIEIAKNLKLKLYKSGLVLYRKIV